MPVNNDIQTALHKAALNGHFRVVKYLLDKADVHARDADGWTALHNACSKVIDFLLIGDAIHLVFIGLS
jgi:ankyrin repeat protein